MQKKTGYRVLVIGGGRWGQITYNNLSSLTSISELNLISRTLNINNSILNNKNTTIKRNLNLKELKKYHLIIICKNNISKFRYFKKIKHLKSLIVIEKPLIIKDNLKKFLLYFKKGKYFISLPWFFEKKIKKIFYNLIVVKKIDRINFFWFDKINKKHGIKKRFDKDTYYVEDIFSHIFSLLYEKFYKNNNTIFSSFDIKKKIENLEFTFNNIKIDLKCSNKINKRYKIIVFFKGEQKISEIKISDKYFLIKDYKTKKKREIANNSDNLIKQYKHLLNQKKTTEFKKTCLQQILFQSQLNKLCQKFQQ